MLDRKATTARIRTLEGEVGTKRSRVNNLVEILAGMEHEDAGVVKAAMHSLRRLFTGEVALLDKAHPPAGGKGAGDGRADSSAERKYRGWLAEKYAAYKQSLSTILSTRADKGLQTLAVVMLMQLFKLESERKIDGFSVDCTKTIPRTLIKSGTPCSAKVIKMFVQNFASEYADVRYYSLKMLAAMLSRVRARSKTGLDTVDAAAVDRALVALLSIQVPKSGDPGVGQFWCASETATPATAAPEERETGGGVDGPPPKKQRRKAQTERGSRVHQARSHRKAFGDCWMELLQMRGLSVGAYRLVLLHMHDQILPNIPHPLLLSDFLTDAYSHGGALSMLSMHGLFILMSKHGLEYPHFFRRLYALLIPSVFHLPHRDQFFKLCAGLAAARCCSAAMLLSVYCSGTLF
jgi:U3 small nucleolar RNA-associated protein 19